MRSYNGPMVGQLRIVVPGYPHQVTQRDVRVPTYFIQLGIEQRASAPPVERLTGPDLTKERLGNTSKHPV